METEIPARCQVEAWDPGVPGITEVFHARIVDWAYPRHVHGTWAVLIVDDGAIRYDLDTRHCGTTGRAVTILPPGVAHDGRPAPGALARGEERLDGEARLALIAERIEARLAPGPARRAPEAGVAGQVRDLLDSRHAEPVSLSEAAALIGRSVPHLVRSFTREFGVSPHAYVPARYARSHVIPKYDET